MPDETSRIYESFGSSVPLSRFESCSNQASTRHLGPEYIMVTKNSAGNWKTKKKTDAELIAPTSLAYYSRAILNRFESHPGKVTVVTNKALGVP